MQEEGDVRFTLDAEQEDEEHQSERSSDTEKEERVEYGQPKTMAVLLSEFSDAESSFFQKFRKLLNEQHISLPSVTVEYNNLNVKALAGAGSGGISNSWTEFVNAGKSVFNVPPKGAVEVTVLNDLQGKLRPGRMTLLLGPSGCGKSSFMRLLVGRLRSQYRFSVQGNVTYNGHEAREFCLARTAAYMEQVDSHNPELTVGEVLQFAYTCQEIPAELQATPAALLVHSLGARASEDEPLDADDAKLTLASLMQKSFDTPRRVETIVGLMGLTNSVNTLTKVCSSGVRRLLSLAEILVGPRTMLLLDSLEASLDSSTLKTQCTLLHELTHHLDYMTLICQQQPPREVMGSFDDVILMAAGNILYHGPMLEVEEYFTSIGFVVPPKDLSLMDFLQDITTPAGQRRHASPGLLTEAAQPPPDSQGYPESDLGTVSTQTGAEPTSPQSWQQELLVPIESMVKTPSGLGPQTPGSAFKRAAGHPTALARNKYGLDFLSMHALLITAQVKGIIRDTFLNVLKLFQLTIHGLLAGSLYWMLPVSDSGAASLFGAIYVTGAAMAYASVSEIARGYEERSIWLKHRYQNLYSAFAVANSVMISRIPVSLIDSTIYSVCFYFMAGFYYSGARFFTFWFYITLFTYFCNILYRMYSTLCSSEFMAQGLSIFTVILLRTASGYTFPADEIPWVIKWLYYINPFTYYQQGISISQMTSPSWRVPSLEDTSYATFGDYQLRQYGYLTSYFWVPFGMLLMVLISAVFYIFYVMSLMSCEKWAVYPQVPDLEEAAEMRVIASKRRSALVKELMGGESPSEEGQGMEILPMEDDMMGRIGGLKPYMRTLLVFLDVRCQVKIENTKRKGITSSVQSQAAAKTGGWCEVLRGITGYVEPGDTLLVLGGPGAGKSVFLDVLAGRKRGSLVEGSIFVNGVLTTTDERWKRIVGYVESNFAFNDTTTVYEALQFSAQTRLGTEVSKLEIDVRIDNALEAMELWREAYFTMNLLRPEQLRRVSMAVEVVSAPGLLLIDEAIAGLDTVSSGRMSAIIRRLSSSGTAVIAAQDKPSLTDLSTFTSTLVLHKGETVYYGVTGEGGVNLIAYFTSLPGIGEQPEGANPVFWVLNSLTELSTVDGAEDVESWAKLYRSSEAAETRSAQARGLIDNQMWESTLALPAEEYALPFSKQMDMITRRLLLAFWRTPSYTLTRLVCTLLAALVHALLYYKAGILPNPATPSDVHGVGGVLYSSQNVLGLINTFIAEPLVDQDRLIFARENSVKCYSAYAYGFALFMVELPQMLVQGILMTLIIYFAAGLDINIVKFLYFFILTLLALCLYTILGYAIAALMPNMKLSNVAVGLIKVIMNLFNGYVITYPNTPIYWKWLNRVNPGQWIIYGLTINQLDSYTGIDVEYNGMLVPLETYAETVLGYYAYMQWWILLIVLAYIVFTMACLIFTLRFVSWVKR